MRAKRGRGSILKEEQHQEARKEQDHLERCNNIRKARKGR
jgi:hypothetical protein